MKEVSQPLQKKLTDDEIRNMIHYLVREEPGMVSFEKLYEALNLDERDQPLKQERVDELKRYATLVKKDMDEASVPAAVQHLCLWMKNNNETSVTTIF